MPNIHILDNFRPTTTITCSDKEPSHSRDGASPSEGVHGAAHGLPAGKLAGVDKALPGDDNRSGARLRRRCHLAIVVSLAALALVETTKR